MSNYSLTFVPEYRPLNEANDSSAIRQLRESMAPIPLIHPIYLDVPMLVSFAAAMQGGLALESEVTAEKSAGGSTKASASAKIGFSQLVQRLFDASASAELAGERKSEAHESRKELKSHTEASIAILLYHQLQQAGGYIIQPKDLADLGAVGPGTLVEVAGTVNKNAVDAVIDYMDAVSILSSLDTSQATNQHGKGKPRNVSTKSQLQLMRDALDSDRKRTPISNVVVRCSEPNGLSVVVTLRTENLRDLTLSELHKNNVRVVGKVTRVIGKNQAMSSFENYGMSMLPPKMLNEIFGQMTKQGEMVAEFCDVEVQGPAVQILPLMVFV